ncbi:30S ribosomal protein S14 [Candidatus Woesearchaeota archaeon]|jgi:small subunit ribosomal protein S14|nr:30S ribosomal protein S14 [Candidatus Woesearchaeota archaeon]|tara:strand:- start:7045 stop:7275 length:231 start_codon:yes stop_codon:yes gene_type:complete
MTYSNYKKEFKQLKAKPVKLKKFLKHNAPKKRSCGRMLKRCGRCGRIRSVISSYGLYICRQCFRETAINLGFKKNS